MNKPTLLILAAGMGSRYGGLKQIDEIGPSGEAIIDYSIFDAIRAGFGKVVLVIRRELEQDFRAFFGNKLDGKIEMQFVYQEIDNVPKGIEINVDRQKPWGTGHAILVARDAIDEPFVVINADDFYGADAYQAIADYFKTNTNHSHHAMVGYQLKGTLSDFGTVSRGICVRDEQGFLQKIEEITKIGIVLVPQVVQVLQVQVLQVLSCIVQVQVVQVHHQVHHQVLQVLLVIVQVQAVHQVVHQALNYIVHQVVHQVVL